MLPLKNKPNILSLVHRRLPCLSAAKLMRLTHTQGRDELPSEITKWISAALGIVRTSSALLSLLPQVTSRLLPVSCSCLTMTWAMAVTSSAPAKAGQPPARRSHRRWLFLCPCGTEHRTIIKHTFTETTTASLMVVLHTIESQSSEGHYCWLMSGEFYFPDPRKALRSSCASASAQWFWRPSITCW